MNYIFDPTCQIDNNRLNEIYKETFGYITNGYFCEVGGYDCKTFSNTYGLSKIGWHGLYIEPVIEFLNAGKNYHKENLNIRFENCAIDSIERTTDLYLGDWATTICENIMKVNTHWLDKNRKRQIQTYTLDSILKKHCVKRDFELLIIDTEGNDLEVLQSFSIGYYNPKLVIIEYTHERFNEFIDFFSMYNYKLINQDTANLIFRK